MFLYMIAFYAIFGDLILGFWNLVLIKKFRFLEGAALFPPRVGIPQRFYSVQKMWPLLLLLFMAVINTICVLLGNILTTLLYNGAVTDKWNRAYMFTKTHFVIKLAPPSAPPPALVVTESPVAEAPISPSPSASSISASLIVPGSPGSSSSSSSPRPILGGSSLQPSPGASPQLSASAPIPRPAITPLLSAIQLQTSSASFLRLKESQKEKELKTKKSVSFIRKD